MTTIISSVNSVLTHANGQQRPLSDFLDQAITETSTEVLLRHNYAEGLAAGQWIEVEQEAMLIVDRNDAWLTVARSITGNSGVAHPHGAIVTLNPPTFYRTVLSYLRGEALTLPSTIYSTGQTDVVFDNANPYAELHAEEDVLDVLYAWKEPTELNQPIRRVRLRLLDGTNLLDASSRHLVQTMPDPGYFPAGAIVHCQYAYRPNVRGVLTPFTVWEELGFTPQVVEALQYGAAYRVMMDREAARSQLTGQNADRRAVEVPPTHNAQTAEMFRRTRAQLLSAEAQRLIQTYNITIQ